MPADLPCPMKGCQGCDGCKKDPGRCVQKDDLSPILQELGQYDAIVLGTPIYWWHVNPQLKMLTDRFYCFFTSGGVNPESGEFTYESSFPQGRKFVVVTSRESGEDSKFFPELYGYLSEWLKMLTIIMGASATDFISHCGSLNDKNSARNNPDLVARAESIGAFLF